jgi:hypothetical protein
MNGKCPICKQEVENYHEHINRVHCDSDCTPPNIIRR